MFVMRAVASSEEKLILKCICETIKFASENVTLTQSLFSLAFQMMKTVNVLMERAKCTLHLCTISHTSASHFRRMKSGMALPVMPMRSPRLLTLLLVLHS